MTSRLGAARTVGQWLVGCSLLALAAGAFSAFGIGQGYAFDPSEPVKNTCSIARNGDVAQVIGKVIKPADQIGPQADASTPGETVTACSFEGASGALTINIQQFTSPDNASGELTQTISNLQSTDQPGEKPVVSQETGLGQTIYWVVSKVQTNVDDPTSIVPKGTYIVLANNRVVTVGTDWSDASPEDLKPALFKLTKAVLDRVS